MKGNSYKRSEPQFNLCADYVILTFIVSIILDEEGRAEISSAFYQIQAQPPEIADTFTVDVYTCGGSKEEKSINEHFCRKYPCVDPFGFGQTCRDRSSVSPQIDVRVQINGSMRCSDRAVRCDYLESTFSITIYGPITRIFSIIAIEFHDRRDSRIYSSDLEDHLVKFRTYIQNYEERLDAKYRGIGTSAIQRGKKEREREEGESLSFIY